MQGVKQDVGGVSGSIGKDYYNHDNNPGDSPQNSEGSMPAELIYYTLEHFFLPVVIKIDTTLTASVSYSVLSLTLANLAATKEFKKVTFYLKTSLMQ